MSAEPIHTQKVKRPMLRHFGGKWQLRHWIIEHLPDHNFYAEPYAGAASILLAKDPAPGGEIINDLNREVINLFRIMRDNLAADELVRRLSWTPYAARELKLALEWSDDRIEQARRLLVRSFMGIETVGIDSTGKTGFRMGNVNLDRLDQSGTRTFRNCAKDWSNWKSHIESIRTRLHDVMIYERDALEFIELMNSKECLLYVDPPYHPETRSSTKYRCDLSAEDHSNLIEVLLGTNSMVVLSGYDHADYRRLEHFGWRKVVKKYRANMSTTPRNEVLWIKVRRVE